MFITITKENINSLPTGFLKREEVEEELINNPFGKYIIYVEKDNPFLLLGYIYYSEIYDRVEINQFEVEKAHRNCGIGNKLLKKFTEIVEKGITLEVRENNKNAIYLYEKYGFQQVAKRKKYYQEIDGLLMERKIKEGISMKDVYILGIESSCDETSVSIIKNGCSEIATVISSQIDIHKEYGGVVPEIASRHHVKNITFVLEESLEQAQMKIEEIDAIAITYGPGLIGSLLVGLEAAKILSYLYHKPLIPVHHIAGHIYANSLVKPLNFPLLALVVSGGHTELIEMRDHFEFTKLGGTLDDAIGECYDKVARVIGLEYPGGPKIDQLARVGKDTYQLPIPLKDNSYNFSFSGLKSAVINLSHNEKQRGNKLRKEDLATSFQKVAVESVITKTRKALLDKNIKHLIVAGGVAANAELRTEIIKMAEGIEVEVSIPPMKYCTDNAAMIAAAGYYAYKLGRRADFSLNSLSSDPLK